VTESDHIGEYRRQGQAKIQEEQAAFAGGLVDEQDQLLKWAESGESGDAKFFIHLYRGQLCFDHAAGLWYRFAGHFWELCELEEQLDKIEALIEVYAEQAMKCSWRKMTAIKAGNKEEAKKAEAIEQIFLKKIMQLRRRRYRQDVLVLAAAGEDSLGITGREWDVNPLLLPFKNGVLELETEIFRPGRPDDWVKVVCPVHWEDFDAPCPKWKMFLNDIMAGNGEKIGYLKRLLGSAITGKVVEHILPIFYGKEGRNGKGVFLETQGHVLGPLAGPVQGELLLAQKYARSSAAPSPDIMGLRGKRLVWASETDEGRKLNSGKVKWLVGGDTLVGRGPFDRREVSFKPSHSLILLTNFKPVINPADAALWQRIHLVEFPVSFVDDPSGDHQKPRNPHIVEELKEEAPGIMAWLVDGYYEYLEKGLAPPSPVLVATQEYRRDEDSIGQFIQDCCIVGEGKMAWLKDLYEEYTSFCEDAGFKPVGKKKLSTILHDEFLKDRDVKGIYYNGIGLKDAG
jgi:putative DNA primase/helicase